VAKELRPGVFEAVFTRLADRGVATGMAAMTSLALAVERRAKDNLAKSRHRRGMPTAARPGGPPALVSGTLRRSVTHGPPKVGPGEVTVRVGLGAGFYPPYPAGGKRTMSSKYGYYLETGLRNGAKYPFLHPAFLMVARSGDVGRFVVAAWRQH
jgi:hypothetical protein